MTGPVGCPQSGRKGDNMEESKALRLFDEAERINIVDTGLLPHSAGLYAVEQEGDIVYVGRAKDLNNRWHGHHKKGLFLGMSGTVTLAYVLVNETQLVALETEVIRALEPEYNWLAAPNTDDSPWVIVGVPLHKEHDYLLLEYLKSRPSKGRFIREVFRYWFGLEVTVTKDKPRYSVDGVLARHAEITQQLAAAIERQSNAVVAAIDRLSDEIKRAREAGIEITIEQREE